ncbi:hypothetical protein K3495_g12436 [Podosphaera aphanis]|nr:hypothetical protein K3495_g12436 [Podosphaera aphanis]
MPILSFSLIPESLNKLHDALICLGKFSDTVTIEASQQKLILTTLNSTKSGYASFTLSADKFFSRYQFKQIKSNNLTKERFAFKIYNRSLLSVFKGRAVDSNREKDTAIERCEASVEDKGKHGKSRFVVKIICRHGVNKTYSLTYELVTPMHALFVKESAHNYWSISSKILKEFAEHFAPGTEQLDIYSEGGRVVFTSFTEKTMLGDEILKQPLHTVITIDTLEFTEFSVEEMLHIIINVKDFKAIAAHSGLNNTVVKALFSYPSNPIQITYEHDGIQSEFILMTIGEARGLSIPNGSRVESRVESRVGTKRSLPPEASLSSRKLSSKIPVGATPARNMSQVSVRTQASKPSSPPLQQSVQSDSLFLPQADNDSKWDPAEFQGEDNEILMWDYGKEDFTIINHEGEIGRPTTQNQRLTSKLSRQGSSLPDEALEGVPPTQKLSQVRHLGIFD